jgi:hypothetical protein
MDVIQGASIRLCDACKVVPWGEKGWEDFFSDASFRTRLAWMSDQNDIPEKVIAYSIKVEALYKEYYAHSCNWCSLLVTGLTPRLPETLEAAQKHEWSNLEISLEFKAPQNVEPRKINAFKLGCCASAEKGFSYFSAVVGVSANRGKYDAKVVKLEIISY